MSDVSAVSLSGYKSGSLHTLNRFCIWSTPFRNNPPGNEWQLHTFLNCFSDSENHQVEGLISESKCSQTGHPKKARKLIQKWLRYKRRNGVEMNPKIEKVLWRVGKASRSKETEKGEEMEEIEVLEVPPPYVEETMKRSEFNTYTYTGEFPITTPPLDPISGTVDTIFQRPRKRSLTLGDIISGDPTELKRRRVGSHATSRILTKQLEVQRLEEAIQELEKERQVKQQLVDRYNSLSVFRECMLDEISPSITTGVNQYRPPERFIGNIKVDSMLYLNNYRQDLDVFIYLYGIDSARVSSLLDHTVEIFNLYATNIDKRSRIVWTFNRLIQYLVSNNFSWQCQQPQREFDNLRDIFLQELSRP